MIRVLICDDQEVVRKGLNIILSHADGLVVVGQAANGAEAIEQTRLHAPDVICMDLKMPIMDGVVATRRICRSHPTCRVLVLTTFDDDTSVFDAIRAGASGYLLKDAGSDEIVRAVRNTAAGLSHLDPSVAAKVLAAVRDETALVRTSRLQTQLTERELTILQLMADGYSNGEIGTRLHLAHGTVKNNVSRLLQKLGADDRTQAVLTGLREGVIQL